MQNSSTDDLVPDGGYYARLPIPACKELTYSGNKSAARVLYALCIHLGKPPHVVFPGYPTIALFAGISENNIKSNLKILVSRGYVSIEKKRIGRKFQNYYSILPSAYLDSKRVAKKSPRKNLDSNTAMICTSCYEYVSQEEVELVRSRDWEGAWDERWVHKTCTVNGSCRVREALPGVISERENYILRQQIERGIYDESFNGDDDSDSF